MMPPTHVSGFERGKSSVTHPPGFRPLPASLLALALLGNLWGVQHPH
jgi:hypothetical protein